MTSLSMLTLVAGTGAALPATAATPAETRQIAGEAYLWGFPMVESYKTLYAQAVEVGGQNFRAPMNRLGSAANVFTPADTAIVTPNTDTPYSMMWMDLRAEPLVLTLPTIDAKRYFSVQLVDLYTYNFDYLGTRTTGNGGGVYMVAGPGWQGETPAGVDKVIRSETWIAYAIYRTQLFGAKDIDHVRRIQDTYRVQPLSEFLGQPTPPAAERIPFPPYEAQSAHALGFFHYLGFLLQFAPVHPSEATLRERFTRIGVVPGKRFVTDGLAPDIRQALLDGIADARRTFTDFKKARIDTHEIDSGALLGSRAELKDDYLCRFAGATLGIFGNSKAEAMYPAYFVDATGRALDASAGGYTVHFDKGQLPPTRAFWSLTMYDGRSQLLVDNPLDRYQINSPMLPDLAVDPDGGITLYLQADSPGKDKENNWLPSPRGPFYAVLRIYYPDRAALDGSWTRPAMRRSG